MSKTVRKWTSCVPTCKRPRASASRSHQGYTGAAAAEAAAQHGIQLEVVKLSEAKRGFVLLPRRWVVERSFGWTGRFRRLARDYERLTDTLRGMHYITFAILFVKRLIEMLP